MYNSGDEAIKFCSCITDWALPDLTPNGAIDVNFAGDVQSSGAKEGQVVPWVSPFNLAFNTKLGYFEWLELPENASRFNRFGHAMTGTRQWETKDGILQGMSMLSPCQCKFSS